jgi:DNA-binding LacI/PurR family transcriptional regulator
LALVIANSNYDFDTEMEFLNLFRQRRLAGIILTGINSSTLGLAKELSKSGLPCVVTWETVDDPEISYVGFDNRKAAYTMTKYLLELNHRRIALISGPPGKAMRATMRYQGYKEALQEYGAKLDPSLVFGSEPTLENGRSATQTILASRKPPTAIFAASDTMAIGALRAIKDAGLKVPEDISLAGFDDIDLASYCDPPLTTIRVPEYEMGKKAVQTLLVLMGNPPDHVERHCLETELIVRDSCRYI